MKLCWSILCILFWMNSSTICKKWQDFFSLIGSGTALVIFDLFYLSLSISIMILLLVFYYYCLFYFDSLFHLFKIIPRKRHPWKKGSILAFTAALFYFNIKKVTSKSWILGEILLYFICYNFKNRMFELLQIKLR